MINHLLMKATLRDFVTQEIDCCEDLVDAILEYSFPVHPSSFNFSTYRLTLHANVHLHRDAIYLDSVKELLIYPRVISSADTKNMQSWDYMSSCSFDSAVLREALLVIQETVHANTLPDDVWRVWISFGESEKRIYLYFTLSDPFKRIDFSFVFENFQFEPVCAGVHFNGHCFHLSRGIFTVDGFKFETEGKFVYNFISRIVASTESLLFYAEAGQLIRISVDHEKRSASAKLQPLFENPTVINIFPWPGGCVGILAIKSTGEYSIRLVNPELQEISRFPQMEKLSSFKLFGIAMDESRRIHLLPVDDEQVVLLTPEYDTEFSLH